MLSKEELQALRDWITITPPFVKDLFTSDIEVINFWRSKRNKSFQMPGKLDGAMSEDCKATMKRDYEICLMIHRYLCDGGE